MKRVLHWVLNLLSVPFGYVVAQLAVTAFARPAERGALVSDPLSAGMTALGIWCAATVVFLLVVRWVLRGGRRGRDGEAG